MAKVQGSDGKWYEGTVKDGRIWTAKGNTGVAPYKKKTVLSAIATDADRAYAAAHQDRYNPVDDAGRSLPGLPAVPGAPALPGGAPGRVPGLPMVPGATPGRVPVRPSSSGTLGREGGLTAGLTSSVSNRVVDRATLQRIQSSMAQVRSPASNKSVAGPPTVPVDVRDAYKMMQGGIITPEQFNRFAAGQAQPATSRTALGVRGGVSAAGVSGRATQTSQDVAGLQEALGALSASERAYTATQQARRGAAIRQAGFRGQIQQLEAQISDINRAAELGALTRQEQALRLLDLDGKRTQALDRLRQADADASAARRQPSGVAAAAPAPVASNGQVSTAPAANLGPQLRYGSEYITWGKSYAIMAEAIPIADGLRQFADTGDLGVLPDAIPDELLTALGYMPGTGAKSGSLFLYNVPGSAIEKNISDFYRMITDASGNKVWVLKTQAYVPPGGAGGFAYRPPRNGGGGGGAGRGSGGGDGANLLMWRITA